MTIIKSDRKLYTLKMSSSPHSPRTAVNGKANEAVKRLEAIMKSVENDRSACAASLASCKRDCKQNSPSSSSSSPLSVRMAAVAETAKQRQVELEQCKQAYDALVVEHKRVIKEAVEVINDERLMALASIEAAAAATKHHGGGRITQSRPSPRNTRSPATKRTLDI